MGYGDPLLSAVHSHSMKRIKLFLACLIAAQCLMLPVRAEESSIDAAALREKARALEHGEGVKKDPGEAIRHYCRAAKLGDVDSLYRLGWLYTFGKGVQRDDAAAGYFFAQAAERGHPQSQNMLRLMGGKVASAAKCPEDEPSDDIGNLAHLNEEQRHLAELIQKLAPQYGVSPRLAYTLAKAESNLNPRALSVKNAQGIMQLIPETAERFNVRKPWDPEQNIRGGLAYLRWLLAYFQGDVALVAAAYNAGEGIVNKYMGIPPYPETRAYVSNILAGYKQPRHPFDARVTEPSPDLHKILRKKAGKAA